MEVGGERRLDPRQPLVDAFPAGGDEVDEQSEVVNPGGALGEQIVLNPLEPADRLAGEPAGLGELARDGEGLPAQALANGLSDPVGERRLELRRGFRERLDLVAGSFERDSRRRRVRFVACGLGEAPHRPLDRVLPHGLER